MVIKILWSFIILLLLWYFWSWLTQNFLFKWKKFPFIKIFLLSFSLVFVLLASDHLLQLFHLSFSETDFSGFPLFCWYLLIFFLFLLLCFYREKIKKSWLFLLLLFLGLLWVGFLGLHLGIRLGILFLLLSVYTEELLKIGTSKLFSSKYQILPSDFLFFSLLFAVGFSFFENCGYLLSLGMDSFSTMLSSVFGRGIFSSLIHFLASGMISLILFKYCTEEKPLIQKIGIILGGFLVGVLIHFWYDLLQGSILLYIIILIGGYFFLTYLLYLSDQLYLPK